MIKRILIVIAGVLIGLLAPFYVGEVSAGIVVRYYPDTVVGFWMLGIVTIMFSLMFLIIIGLIIYGIIEGAKSVIDYIKYG